MPALYQASPGKEKYDPGTSLMKLKHYTLDSCVVCLLKKGYRGKTICIKIKGVRVELPDEKTELN